MINKLTKFMVLCMAIGFYRWVEACECPRPNGPVIEYAMADAVFFGTVTEAGDGKTTKLVVTEALKGSIDKNIEIAPGVCGYIFEPSKKYLVYAKYHDKQWTASLCGRTRLASAAKEELKRIPRDKKSCESWGGHWGRYGASQSGECNLYTSDAGTSCTDHAQCQTVCVAQDDIKEGTQTSGKCFDRTIIRGRCLNFGKDGKAAGIRCNDT